MTVREDLASPDHHRADELAARPGEHGDPGEHLDPHWAVPSRGAMFTVVFLMAAGPTILALALSWEELTSEHAVAAAGALICFLVVSRRMARLRVSVKSALLTADARVLPEVRLPRTFLLRPGYRCRDVDDLVARCRAEIAAGSGAVRAE